MGDSGEGVQLGLPGQLIQPRTAQQTAAFTAQAHNRAPACQRSSGGRSGALPPGAPPPPALHLLLDVLEHLRLLRRLGPVAGLTQAVAVLDRLAAAGVAPQPVVPPGAPHRAVVVDQRVLLVLGACLDLRFGGGLGRVGVGGWGGLQGQGGGRRGHVGVGGGGGAARRPLSPGRGRQLSPGRSRRPPPGP
jgi:hypothetical protein